MTYQTQDATQTSQAPLDDNQKQALQDLKDSIENEISEIDASIKEYEEKATEVVGQYDKELDRLDQELSQIENEAAQTTSAPATASTSPSNKDWATATDDEILAADVVIELGLGDKTEDEKSQILVRMADIVQNNVINKLLASLSEDKKKELDGVMAKNDPEATFAFIQNNINNLDEVSKKELVEFKRTVLSGQTQL